VHAVIGGFIWAAFFTIAPDAWSMPGGIEPAVIARPTPANVAYAAYQQRRGFVQNTVGTRIVLSANRLRGVSA
jgi:hypothetical protein